MCSGSVPSTEGTGANGEKVGKSAASAGLPLAQPEAVQVRCDDAFRCRAYAFSPSTMVLHLHILSYHLTIIGDGRSL
jgi:hypothetical protein